MTSRKSEASPTVASMTQNESEASTGALAEIRRLVRRDIALSGLAVRLAVFGAIAAAFGVIALVVLQPLFAVPVAESEPDPVVPAIPDWFVPVVGWLLFVLGALVLLAAVVSFLVALAGRARLSELDLKLSDEEREQLRDMRP